MRRTVLLAVLSFLLLSMQHEGLVHPFEHLASRRGQPAHTEFAIPHADDGCVECALLAAGTTAATGSQPPAIASVPVAQLAQAAFASRVADFPASFSSRAPPVLL